MIRWNTRRLSVEVQLADPFVSDHRKYFYILILSVEDKVTAIETINLSDRHLVPKLIDVFKRRDFRSFHTLSFGKKSYRSPSGSHSRNGQNLINYNSYYWSLSLYRLRLVSMSGDETSIESEHTEKHYSSLCFHCKKTNSKSLCIPLQKPTQLLQPADCLTYRTTLKIKLIQLHHQKLILHFHWIAVFAFLYSIPQLKFLHQKCLMSTTMIRRTYQKLWLLQIIRFEKYITQTSFTSVSRDSSYLFSLLSFIELCENPFLKRISTLLKFMILQETSKTQININIQ